MNSLTRCKASRLEHIKNKEIKLNNKLHTKIKDIKTRRLIWCGPDLVYLIKNE